MNSKKKPRSSIFMRQFASQAFVALLLAAVVGWLVSNAQHNLDARNVASGFGFLNREAGLPIAEHLISYTPADTYFRALAVGTLNTLWVAFWGILLATVLGTIIGLARLSKNWLLTKVMSAYVEFFRDIPLLLQLFLWYSLLQGLPPVRQALHPVAGVYLSNRGLSLPILDWQPAHNWVALVFVVGLVLTYLRSRWATKKRLDDGKPYATWPTALGLLIVAPAVVAVATGASFALDIPSPRGFNVQGGVTVSPEFFALLLGLVLYNAAFIAEIVRAGIVSVNQGQREAAAALGLKPGNTMRWVVFPQALRVIVPPLTSQYLNLAKQSSLAVAIGYQDIVSVATTAMNQNGQAVELVAVIMGVYLTLSLSISLLMNYYNARMALVER